MGMFGKISEARMKDKAEGTVRVVGISMPDPTATQANYRMDAVVSADGLMPTAIVHHGMMSVSHWPSPGDELPCTVDRAKPEHIVLHLKDLPTGAEQAQSAAEELAAQMRGGGGATTIPSGTTNITRGPGGVSITVNGVEVPIPAGGGTINLGSDSIAEASSARIPEVSSADILAKGLPGNATVLGTFPSPQQTTKPGCTAVGLMLNVMIDGHAPFQTQNIYAVPAAKMHALTPGALLPVKGDPAQMTMGMVAVDWDAVN
jgi:hypothetical protein